MEKRQTKSQSFGGNLPVALVIGGAGFIGSYVCESLRAQNVAVIAIDDLSSGKEIFLEKLLSDPQFKFIKHNINNGMPEDLPPVNYVMHLGGIESYVNGVDLTLNTMLVNSMGAYHSLELAKKHNSKYLLISSLDIYNGALSSLNMDKYFGLSDRDTKRYTHHEAKRYAEALVIEYYKKHEIDSRIVRIAEVYGPRMDLNAGTELAQLIKDAILSDTLTINGDGLKILHPTFVTDIINGITKAIFSKDTVGKIYNIAAPEETNVLNLAYAIQKNSTKPLKIQFTQEYREIKFPMHKVELAQSQSDLAWQSKTKIEDGITQTLEYFFLSKDKADGTRKIKKEEKVVENTYIPQAVKTEQPKPIQSSGTEAKKKKKVNHANLIILGTSFFIILMLFIFPLTTLYFTSSSAFTGTLKLAEIDRLNTSQEIIATQKSIALANTQFDSLEWFFSMIRQREKFESSRASLSMMDKFTRALALMSDSNQDSNDISQQIVNGNADSIKIDQNTRDIGGVALGFQNAVLESQGIRDTIFGKKETNQIQSVIKQTQQALDKANQQALLVENSRKYLAPKQTRHFALVFLDNQYQNAQGGQVYGFALAKSGSKGIQELKTYPYNESNNEYASVIEAIKVQAENASYGNIEAVVLINNNAELELIKVLRTISIEEYAEIINPENANEKITRVDRTNEYKIAIWDALWEKIKEGTNTQGVAEIIQKGIKDENIQILLQQTSGDITTPRCTESNLLKSDFNFETPQNASSYCLVPYLSSVNKLDKISQSYETTVNLQNETQTVKHTFKLSNQDSIAKTFDVNVIAPGNPKLNNVLAPFPVSFDRITINRDEIKTQWIYELTLQPNETKDITFEWTANISDGNIAANGLYVEKQFGALVTSLKAELQTDSGKSIQAVGKNADLFLKQ